MSVFTPSGSDNNFGWVDDEHDDGEDKKEARSEELEPDPHVRHDVSHAGAIVTEISSQLARVNPEEASFYAENATQSDNSP